MSSSLALIPSSGDSQLDRSAAIRALREMVLNSVVSEHSKRSYAKTLDEVFTLCANRSQGLSLALLMEYRAAMVEKKLSASTVNVRLSAVRKLVGEATLRRRRRACFAMRQKRQDSQPELESFSNFDSSTGRV